MVTGRGRTFLGAILALALYCGWMPGAAAAELSASAQRQIRAATFEVVQPKPPEGDVTYERPLPMDLLPYRERTDSYRSIGTAFAIAPNRYVTAGHVIAVGMGSQFGPPALRDAAGKVYAIDQVLKYSKHEDFVVFTLREPPPQLQYLTHGAKPRVNDAVFTVGNAFGEGLVTRDGVFTSETPEEDDGKWKWLRFTAAASPGNSGGPLVDRKGRVVGVVLRKSPSENLNYALSIDQVFGAREGEGKIYLRTVVRFDSIMTSTEPLRIEEQFGLPQSLSDFYTTSANIIEKQTEGGLAQLLAHNAAHLFPRGPGSEGLLHTVQHSVFPARIREAENGNWVIDSAKPEAIQLQHNGFVELSWGMIRLRAPDDVALSSLYGDSKLEMDLVLKAYAHYRQVGPERIRVTSLGKAQKESTYFDAYGRVWQSRAWAIPYQDSMLGLISLPTPEGFVGVYFEAPSSAWPVMLERERLMLDYIFVTMQGSLTQWQNYLAQKMLQPKVFDSLELDIEGDHRVHFHSLRCDLQATPRLVKLSKSSFLGLDFAFFRDHGAVVWDVAAVYVMEGVGSQNSVIVWRNTEPLPELPAGFQTNWHKLKDHLYPYDATVSTQNGTTLIGTAAPRAMTDGAKIVYGLRVVADGTQPQQAMQRKLVLLQKSFKQLEQ